jgi:hypothetical protein
MTNRPEDDGSGTIDFALAVTHQCARQEGPIARHTLRVLIDRIGEARAEQQLQTAKKWLDVREIATAFES